MDLVTFDNNLIPFQTLGFNINPRTRSGGVSMGGREQITSSGNALWTATGTVRIRTPAMVREWRRMLWALGGRENALLIGPCDCRNGGYIPPGTQILTPHNDQTPFNDGTLYSQGGQAPRVVDSVGVPGTNIVNIYPLSGVNILPGTYIGFDNRFYGIVAVQTIGIYLQLTLRPRIREAITPSSVVRLCDAMRAPMRLTDDSVGALTLSLGRFGDVSLDLIEVYGA